MLLSLGLLDGELLYDGAAVMCFRFFHVSLFNNRRPATTSRSLFFPHNTQSNAIKSDNEKRCQVARMSHPTLGTNRCHTQTHNRAVHT